MTESDLLELFNGNFEATLTGDESEEDWGDEEFEEDWGDEETEEDWGDEEWDEEEQGDEED